MLTFHQVSRLCCVTLILDIMADYGMSYEVISEGIEAALIQYLKALEADNRFDSGEMDGR